MIRHIVLAILLLLAPGAAQAQQYGVNPCVQIPSTVTGGGAAGCQGVSVAYPLPVGPSAMSVNGATPTHVISAASTNATNIKATAGNVYSVVGINTNAATAFLKLYDKATAPTCNTDTVVATYPMVQNVPFSAPSIVGKAFVNGIGLCITGGIADNDNTSATTGIAVNLDFK